MKYFTLDWYNKAREDSEEDWVWDKYAKHRQTLRQSLPEDHIAFAGFHDYTIIKAEIIDCDFIIEFKEFAPFFQHIKIIFHDYEIVENTDLINFDWLYHEVYILDDQRIEVHVLLENGETTQQFIIRAKNIELVDNGKKKNPTHEEIVECAKKIYEKRHSDMKK